MVFPGYSTVVRLSRDGPATPDQKVRLHKRSYTAAFFAPMQALGTRTRQMRKVAQGREREYITRERIIPRKELTGRSQD
jgi:hypothetical protein